ncbi:MAG TPA: CotH kinase family protein [Candidatus Limnocylindria bacterium]|nr:CotH kinase family protein [Candidatus Limnocylindria bacterium]
MKAPASASAERDPTGVPEDNWLAVATYELRMPEEDLLSIERDPFSNKNEKPAWDLTSIGREASASKMAPVTFVAEGHEYRGVQVRVRGSWARTWPKKALKVIFPKDDRFDGHHAVNLNSAWRDPAFLREPLAYHVFASCGLPVPQCHMARLLLNGKFRGLYVDVEQPEKPLLKRNDLKGAILYKALSGQADERDMGPGPRWSRVYERASDKEAGLEDLQKFCRDLQAAPDARAFFEERVNLDFYIDYLAGCVLVQHWDGFNKNHFVVYDAGDTHKWFIMPWDLDRTFGDWWDMSFSHYDAPILLGTQASPGITGWNRLEERFMADPVLRARFLKRLEELLEAEFTTDKLFPLIDQIAAAIAKDAPEDRRRWPNHAGDLRNGVQGVKRFIEQRRAFLKGEIPKLRKAG